MSNILIVEEDHDLRDLLGQITEEAGHSPMIKSETQTLDGILPLPLDLVILGILRPDSYARLLEKLADQAPGLPVISLSTTFDIEKLTAEVAESLGGRNALCNV